MQSKTDKELIVSYVEAADDAAFAELVARYSPMVYRACRRLLGNDHDAEDAVQAAFVVLARKAGSLRQEGRLNGWLHRVARLVALEALRNRSDRERRQEQVAMWQEIQTVNVAEADQDAVLSQVDAALDGLSAILREAVVLRYLRGFSEQEAAAQAGCPVGTMKWRASEALAKLRARLAKRRVTLGGVALASLLTSEASAAVPETLLPSILATVKSAAATGAATTAATTKAAMLAKGAMKAMFIAKVKMVAAVVAAVVVTGTAVPVGIAVAQAVAEKADTTAKPVPISHKGVGSEAESFTARFKMVGVFTRPDSSKSIELVETGAVTSRSFFVSVGDKVNDHILVAINYENASATFAKDKSTTTLSMSNAVRSGVAGAPPQPVGIAVAQAAGKEAEASRTSTNMAVEVATKAGAALATQNKAEVPGEITTAENKVYTGMIRWIGPQKEYKVKTSSSGGTAMIELTVPLAAVKSIKVVEPPELRQAIQAMRNNQLAPAIATLDKLAQNYINLNWDVTATRWLAEAYLRDGKPDLAVRACERVIDKRPETAINSEMAPFYWQALLAAGRINKLEDLLITAENSKSEAEKKFPTARPSAARLTVDAFASQNKFDPAEAELAKMPTNSLEYMSARLLISDRYYQFGNLPKAFEGYDAVLNAYAKSGPPPELRKFYMDSAYKYSQMLLNRNDARGAIKAMRYILMAKPESYTRRTVEIEMAEMLLKIAETLPVGEERKATIKEACALCVDVMWEQDILFGRAVVVLAHCKKLSENSAAARKLVMEKLPMLKGIEKMIEDRVREANPRVPPEKLKELIRAALRESPMAHCNYLLGTLYEDDGRALLAAGKAPEAKEQIGMALAQFVTVVQRYPACSRGPEACQHIEAIIALGKERGWEIDIPPDVNLSVIRKDVKAQADEK